MLDVVEKLLILQDRDQRLRQLQNDLQRLPQERQGVDTKLEAVVAEESQAQATLQENELALKKLELEVESQQSHIAKLQKQQLETRKNEEYQAISLEIERIGRSISKLEDRELELMEEAEGLRKVLVEKKEQSARAKEHAQKTCTVFDEREKLLEERRADVEKESSVLSEDIDAVTLDLYRRLLKNKGDSAVVAIEHGVCQGCHMKVTSQTLLRARGGKELVQCENCGRILYLGDEQ